MVANDGTGLSLPESRGRENFPINCPPEEGPREIGDGPLNTQSSQFVPMSGDVLNPDWALGYEPNRPQDISQSGNAYISPQEHAQPHAPHIISLAPSPQAVVPEVVPQEPPSVTTLPPFPPQVQTNVTPSQPVTGEKQQQNKKIKKNTRASLKVASLNIRGRGPVGDDKWNHINQIMKEQHLGVLAVQESHMTQDHVNNLHALFGKRLQIHFFQGPNANAQGVAIVLNKELTNIKGVEQWNVIPGRAMMIKLPWHSNLSINILNIYAPNAHNDNQSFWEALEGEWARQELPNLDILLGDFNIVEDAIDHLPSHVDPHNVVSSLDHFRNRFRLQDGWRTTNPDTKCFSFLQKSSGAQSRIDRIYATASIIKTAVDWNIETTALNTDHKMVSVKVIDQKAPYFGRGRWTMPLYMLKSNALMQDIQSLGIKLEQELDSGQQRTSVVNPQIYFQSFKDEITEITRAAAKVAIPKMNLQIQGLQKECVDLLKGQTTDTAETQLSLGLLEERIAQLEA